MQLKIKHRGNMVKGVQIVVVQIVVVYMGPVLPCFHSVLTGTTYFSYLYYRFAGIHIVKDSSNLEVFLEL